MSTSSLNDIFLRERPRLMALAWRLTGTRHDAEDLVQEAWLRWQGREVEADNPGAYLARIIVNLALDRWRGWQRERAQYTGPWLPEPGPEELVSPEQGPQEAHEQRHLLGMAWMTLLEKLSPLERAVFVLREAFDYSFAEIGEVVERTEVNCRQIDRRARQHLETDAPRFEVDPGQQRNLLMRFAEAMGSGDPQRLSAILSEDVRFFSDGGGIVRAALRVLEGRERLLAFFQTWLRNQHSKVFEMRFDTVGGEPALLYYEDGRLSGMTTVAVEKGQITAFYTLRNPEKLADAGLLQAPG